MKPLIVNGEFQGMIPLKKVKTIMTLYTALTILRYSTLYSLREVAKSKLRAEVQAERDIALKAAATSDFRSLEAIRSYLTRPVSL